MLTAVAVITSLAFIVWLIFLAVKQRTVKAHVVARGLAYVTGIYTYAFFLSMDLLQLAKVLVSILLGAMLIVLAAYLQRRRQADKQ